MTTETATPETPKPTTGAETVTAADLMGNLSMPEPSERAIQAATSDRNALATATPGDLDTAGRAFDSSFER